MPASGLLALNLAIDGQWLPIMFLHQVQHILSVETTLRVCSVQRTVAAAPCLAGTIHTASMAHLTKQGVDFKLLH